jgi:hypothetical protein
MRVPSVLPSPLRGRVSTDTAGFALTRHRMRPRSVQGANVLKALPGKLRKPGQLLRYAHKTVRNVQSCRGLAAGGRQVQRPVPEGAAALDELGQRDVQDSLATRLRAGDAHDQPFDAGRTLSGGPGELVAVTELVAHRLRKAAGHLVSWRLCTFPIGAARSTTSPAAPCPRCARGRFHDTGVARLLSTEPCSARFPRYSPAMTS